MASTTNYYGVDLGFNWNAASSGTDANNNPICPLQYGILSKGTSVNQNVPITPFGFADVSTTVNDSIFFMAYDITSLCADSKSLPTGDVSLSLTMSFADVNTGSAMSPLNPAPASGSQYSATGQFLASQFSTVFNNSLPAYSLGTTATSNPSGINGQLYTFTGATVTNISLTLTVTNSGTTKNFVLDPEMIVGANNGGNDADDARRPPKSAR